MLSFIHGLALQLEAKTPDIVKTGLKTAKEVSFSALGIISDTLREAQGIASQKTLKSFKGYIEKKNIPQINEVLDQFPFLAIMAVPDCESNEVSYSFLAFAELEMKNDKESLNAMLEHTKSMVQCLISAEIYNEDVERIVKYRPELLIEKIELLTDGGPPKVTRVFHYFMSKGNESRDGHLKAALEGYKKTIIKLSADKIETINKIFQAYYLKIQKANRTARNSTFLSILKSYESSFSQGKRQAVDLKTTPLYNENKDFKMNTSPPPSTPAHFSKGKLAVWNGRNEFQQTADSWYRTLRQRVWLRQGEKLENKLTKPETLYQAAQLINEEHVDSNSPEDAHVLAREINRHRRWSVYSSIAEKIGIKRAPTTSQEILSLLISMSKYRGLIQEVQEKKGSFTVEIRKNFLREEEILHDFQQAVCLDYLKKRGTVWFFSGDKAKQIADSSPDLLFAAAKLIESKDNLTDEKKKDIPAYKLARQLSQHRRWPYLFNSSRAYSACAQSLLSIVIQEKYRSIKLNKG